MSEHVPDNRNMTQLDDLRNTIGLLNASITDLRVVMEGVKGTVKETTGRAVEDRTEVSKVEIRVGSLESFKSRIQGQVALLALIVGVLGTVVTARIMGFMH